MEEIIAKIEEIPDHKLTVKIKEILLALTNEIELLHADNSATGIALAEVSEMLLAKKEADAELKQNASAEQNMEAQPAVNTPGSTMKDFSKGTKMYDVFELQNAPGLMV